MASFFGTHNYIVQALLLVPRVKEDRCKAQEKTLQTRAETA